MATRAIRELKQKRIPFAVVQYEHLEKGAEFAARATGFDLKRTIKTLVVDLGQGRPALALMPGDRELNLKALAKCLGIKRAAMADTRSAERLTGYLVGGISPFGTKQRFRVIMEQDLLKHDQVVINAGQRGVMLKMHPQDILQALNGQTAAIAR